MQQNLLCPASKHGTSSRRGPQNQRPPPRFPQLPPEDLWGSNSRHGGPGSPSPASSTSILIPTIPRKPNHGISNTTLLPPDTHIDLVPYIQIPDSQPAPNIAMSLGNGQNLDGTGIGDSQDTTTSQELLRRVHFFSPITSFTKIQEILGMDFGNFTPDQKKTTPMLRNKKGKEKAVETLENLGNTLAPLILTGDNRETILDLSTPELIREHMGSSMALTTNVAVAILLTTLEDSLTKKMNEMENRIMVAIQEKGTGQPTNRTRTPTQTCQAQPFLCPSSSTSNEPGRGPTTLTATASTTTVISSTINNRPTPPRAKERRTPPGTKQNKAKNKPNPPDLRSNTLGRHRYGGIPDHQKKKNRSLECTRNKSHQRDTYSAIHPICQTEMPPDLFSRKRLKNRRRGRANNNEN
ncbi:hypothetical protein L873DRAFT_1787662 [Choiromyces venosus 120613-1]|uniref:Uncharacterized protein n=1 Tax=Choiromyces venosus 120613-1 TaxID=1336337 RepID=A0A3N4JVN3_9PEZI|nr:hypothetical protein L873DRAFT_1787662 [Choiromyces venosus 120613-1]